MFSSRKVYILYMSPKYLTDLLWCTDNPIAQNLLVKQLERYQLNVIATGNGHEALAGRARELLRVDMLIYICAEWEAREPGYFSVALFDHRELPLYAFPCRLD
jgi:hypothetical protein